MKFNVSNISALNSVHRIDAEFFMPDSIQAREVVCSFPKITTLSKITSRITQGPNPKFTEGGIPCLNGKNIYFGTAKSGDTNFVSSQTFGVFKKYALKQSDIVITLKHATEIGRSWIITDDEPKIFTRNVGLIRLRRDSQINPATLLFYIWSDYAQKMLYRLATGGTSGQITLTTSALKTLPVPILPEKLQNELENHLQKYKKILLESERKYEQAENLLLEELGLKDFKSTHKLSYLGKSSEIQNNSRMDAEYYRPHYDAIIEQIHKYGCEKAKKAISIIDKNYAPKKGIKYKYIELTNIAKDGFINDCMIEFGENLPSRARRLIKKNDVIISSIEGSLQSCALVTEEYENALCSTGFYVIRSSLINPETLLILFKSSPIQELLKKGCSGTILTAINKTELEKIPIPLIKNNVQKEIAINVMASRKARTYAKELLEKAKEKVETVVENSTR